MSSYDKAFEAIFGSQQPDPIKQHIVKLQNRIEKLEEKQRNNDANFKKVNSLLKHIISRIEGQ